MTTVSLEISGGIARITLDRPDARNTVSLELARDLHDATSAMSSDPNVRAVLITGRGDSFCAGGDLKSFYAQPDMSAHIKEVTDYLHPAIDNIDQIDAPVVTAVRGAAAGAGLGLACVGDIVLASTTAKFVSAYTRIGLVPDGSTSWSLPRLVGVRRALELTLTNRMLDAVEALEWGLVTRVVEDDQLDAEAEALVTELAAGPTHAFGRARRLIRDSLGRSAIEQMAAEQEAIVESAKTADAKEGVGAFLEKRTPKFGA